MMQILSFAPQSPQAASGAAAATAGAEGGDVALQGADFFSALLARQIKTQLESGLPTLDASQMAEAAPDEAVLKDFLKNLKQQDENGAAAVPSEVSSVAALVAQIASASHQQAAQSGEKVLAQGSGEADTARPVAAPVGEGTFLQRPEGEKKDSGAEDFAAGGKGLPLEAAESARKHGDKDADVTASFADKLVAARHDVPRVEAQGNAAGLSHAKASVEPRVGAPEWGDAFGQKVVWLAGQQKQSAELQLNPPHLGPLEVKITMGQDQMTASFVSNHAAVREAIESALPRLRDMLADSGIMLGNVTVGAESFAQQQQQQQQQSQSSSRGGEEAGVFSLNGGVEGRPEERQVAVTRIGEDGWVNTYV